MNAIQRLESEILECLDPQGTYDSWQISDALLARGKNYSIEGVQMVLGYLVDSGKIKVEKRRYVLA